MSNIPPEVGADESPDRPHGKRLDSWKEIAAYLKRDVATVRRWEKREALPIHRHLHEKLASVSAYTSELEAWAEGRRLAGDQVPSGSALRVQIDEPSRTDAPARGTLSAAVIERARWMHWDELRWVAVGALALALALLIARGPGRRGMPQPEPLRLSADLGVSLAPFNVQFGAAAVLSRDGTVVVFVAQEGTRPPQMHVRRLDQLQAEPLAGTDDALSPFFSPDGQWIGFFAHGKLKKIAVTGGAPVTLADAVSNRGGSWSDDDTIVFSPDQIPGTRLLRISSNGGTAEPLTALADGEVIQAWPQVLPGGKAVLYTSSSISGAFNDANVVLQVLPSGLRKVVQRGGYHGRYLASGHLAYVHNGTLFAAPFNFDRLETTGQPIAALAGVSSNAVTGGAQFAASEHGTFLYLPGPVTGAGIPIHWMGHDGNTTPLMVAPANWSTPSFAPNGRQLAMEIRAGSSDIWVYEWERDTLTRLTSGADADQRPVWTPDSRRIAFASSRAGTLTTNLYWQRADGTGDAQRLTESTNAQRPSSWHPSGKFLAFEETTAQTKVDVMILPLEGDDSSGWKPGTPTAFLKGDHVEFDPAFSPDGRWLAYASVESGRPEVYVRPFPGPGGRWLIGTGANPTWSHSKRELFYGIDGRIMVAPFAVDGVSFNAEKPHEWSDGRYQTRGSTRMFDLHRDGERFALAPATQRPIEERKRDAVFILNFFDELRRLTHNTRVRTSTPSS